MLTLLSQWDRDRLIAVCSDWTARLSEGESEEILRDAVRAFYDWQESQSDKDGMIEVEPGLGLLSVLQPKQRKPISELKPWQCAGFFVNDALDLALHLWCHDEAHFAALLKKHLYLDVFALLATASKRSTSEYSFSTSSLVQVATMISRGFRAKAESYEKMLVKAAPVAAKAQRMTRNLSPEGRALGREQQKQKALAKRGAIRKAAVDYYHGKLREGHSPSKDDALDFLVNRGIGKRSVIEKIIRGAKDEAIQLLAQNPPSTRNR
jgi:hypothetical protein